MSEVVDETLDAVDRELASLEAALQGEFEPVTGLPQESPSQPALPKQEEEAVPEDLFSSSDLSEPESIAATIDSEPPTEEFAGSFDNSMESTTFTTIREGAESERQEPADDEAAEHISIPESVEDTGPIAALSAAIARPRRWRGLPGAVVVAIVAGLGVSVALNLIYATATRGKLSALPPAYGT